MCTAFQIILSSFLSLTPEIIQKVRSTICIIISLFIFIRCNSFFQACVIYVPVWTNNYLSFLVTSVAAYS